jgi:hypothetical protein
MPISQNARFCGEAGLDEDIEDRPGKSIAALLASALIKQGWATSDLDCWRDCGWSFTCRRAAASLELVIAEATGEWFLQIAPSYVPGLAGRLRKKPASASADDVQALARDVFAVLSEGERFSQFKWCWDGFPQETNSSHTPMPPERL